MSRVLETVLTGRNLLSPVLATAARDVTAYSSTVTAQQGKAAASAQTAASTQARAATTAAAATTTGSATQSAAAQKIAVSNVKASTSAQASASAQMRAHTQAAQSATVASRAQQAANDSLIRSNGLLGGSLTPLTAGLGAVALGLGYAGYRGMEFDSAMSQVQAASQATAGDMDRLRTAAIDAGAGTAYSAEEAAGGITELSKAGVATADILNGGLNGALSLAAAGQMEVADAAEIGATALSVFRLEGDQMSHVADLLAAGAGKAQGSVYDLGAALNQSALVADQTGLSIEDTAGALAMFASNGLTGSDAGTSFKTMLQALTPNSEAAAKAMDAIGFSAYDAQGNFVGLEGVAAQLKDGLSGLSVEQQNATLKTIFGADAVRAAAILYKEGSVGVRQWRDNVNDAGYAQEQAAQLTDNLKGDLEKLGGAFDSAMTSIGGGVQGPLREVVQALTGIIEVGGDVIGFWNNLPGPVQTAVVAFVALTALRGPMDMLFGRIAVGITSTVTGMGMATGATTGLGVAAGVARTAMARLATAAAPLVALTVLTSAATAIMEFTKAGDNATESVQSLNDAIEDAESNDVRFDTIEAGLDSIRQKAADAQAVLDGYDNQNLFNKYVWSGLGEPGELRDAEQSLASYNDQIERLEEASQRGEQSTGLLAEKLRLSKTEVVELADKYGIDLTGSLEDTQGRFEEMYTAEYGTTPVDAANALGEAVTSAKQQTEEAIAAQEKWLEGLQQIADGFVEPLGAYTELLEEKKTKERESAEATAAATEDATDSWEDYADDVTVSLDELATRLEEQLVAQDRWRENIGIITQRGGLEVGQILAGMGEEGVQLAAQMANGTDAEFNRMADLLIEDARRGGAGAAAEFDNYMKIMAANAAVGGQATVQGLAAQLGLGVDVVRDIAARYGISLAEGVNPILASLGKGQILAGGRVTNTDARNVTGVSRAEGGTIPGPYIGPKADNVLIRANPREFMQPVAAVDHYGVDFMEAVRTRRFPKDAIAGYAEGGFITSANVPRPPSTAPYGPPISTAGDATMQKGFDEVRAWLDANAEATQGGTAGTGAVTGAWGSLWSLVKGQIPQARMNSTYRPGDPGYHGKGKAIDFGFGSGPGGAGSAGLASINRLLHDQVGASIAQLIYDGIGDDRPDLLMGRPHNYGAATQAEHRNHVHAAVRDSGGLVPSGTAGLNLSGRDERMLSPRQTEAFEQWMNSPAAMPGYGAAANGGAAPSGPVHVLVDARVFVGDREITDIARVEANAVYADAKRSERINGRSV